MTDEIPDTYAPPAVRRAATIRKLAHGEGLTPAAVAALERHEMEDFSVNEPEQLYDLLKFTAQLMQYNDPKAGAIKAALGLVGSYKKTLTERRWAYLEEDQVDMSLRTLMRYEQEGAELMAQQVEVALTMPTPNATWQNSAFSEMKTLRRDLGKTRFVLSMVIDQLLERSPAVYLGKGDDAERIADRFGVSPEEVGKVIAEFRATEMLRSKYRATRPATESESAQDQTASSYTGPPWPSSDTA